jgi:polysaccharide pyruvyl transferase
MQSALYVGWIGYGNLGDEAMLEVCEARFADYRWTPFEVWNAQPQPKNFARRAARSPAVLFKAVVDELRTGRRLRGFLTARKAKVNLNGGPSFALLGGGTLINANDEFLNQYRTARERLRCPVPVFSCGAKTPDFFAGKGGWKDHSREWIEATSDLPVVGVRGPLSKGFLDSAGARNVSITGDPAVWLHRPLSASPPSRLDRRLKIGVNCGSATFIWGDLSVLIEAQAETVRQLVSRGFAVELFAICAEDMDACEEVARRANVGITPVPEPLTSYAKYAAKLDEFDLVIALKLHAGVLAACANVPFVMLEYQPKCRDFCASIGWENYNIRTDCADPGTVLQLVETLLHDLAATRSALCRRMCDLRSTFESYCKHLERNFAELSAAIPALGGRQGRSRIYGGGRPNRSLSHV